MGQGCDAGALHYRGHCIRAWRRKRGWTIRVSRAGVTTSPPASLVLLRNNVPQGRAMLMTEARHWIDRLVDGPPWQGSP